MRKALHLSVLLRRAVIFGHKENKVFQDSTQTKCRCREVRDLCEEPTSQLCTCLERKVIGTIRVFFEWESGHLGGYHQIGCCVFAGRCLDTCCCFLLGLPSRLLSGCCRFVLRLLKPGSLLDSVHYKPPRCFSRRFGKRVRIRGLSGVGYDDSPPRTT